MQLIYTCILFITFLLLLAFASAAQRQQGFSEGYLLGYQAAQTSSVPRELKPAKE